MKSEYVVTFYTTADAMHTEKLCREHQIGGRLIPVPPTIHGECGMAWRLPPTEKGAFQDVVLKEVRTQGLFKYDFRF